MVGAPTMSLHSWKQLARWSIDYSCLNEKQKTEGHAILAQDWKEFCANIIAEYGPMVTGDEVDVEKAKNIYEKHRHQS